MPEDLDTRTRILDAAERLFAEHGLQGASVRAITEVAGANVAAVHYHFGGKESLLDAVFARRLEPLEAERRQALEGLGPHPASIEAVMAAFVRPAMQRVRGDPSGDVFLRLMSRIYAESSQIAERISSTWLRPTARRFIAALVPLLPDMPETELKLRFHLAIGALARAGMIHHRLPHLIGRDPGLDEVTRLLVDFVSAGLRGRICDKDIPG